MQIKRFLNDVPINDLQGMLLHDEVIVSIVAGVRERTAENESN